MSIIKCNICCPEDHDKHYVSKKWVLWYTRYPSYCLLLVWITVIIHTFYYFTRSWSPAISLDSFRPTSGSNPGVRLRKLRTDAQRSVCTWIGNETEWNLTPNWRSAIQLVSEYTLDPECTAALQWVKQATTFGINIHVLYYEAERHNAIKCLS